MFITLAQFFGKNEILLRFADAAFGDGETPDAAKGICRSRRDYAGSCKILERDFFPGSLISHHVQGPKEMHLS